MKKLLFSVSFVMGIGFLSAQSAPQPKVKVPTTAPKIKASIGTSEKLYMPATTAVSDTTRRATIKAKPPKKEN